MLRHMHDTEVVAMLKVKSIVSSQWLGKGGNPLLDQSQEKKKGGKTRKRGKELTNERKKMREKNRIN